MCMYPAFQLMLFCEDSYSSPFRTNSDRFNALIQFAMISQAIAAKQVCEAKDKERV